MKETDINGIVLQKLNEFENLERIHPSEAWNKSLINRLSGINTASTSVFLSAKFIIALLFFVLINAGFILNSMVHNPNHRQDRNGEFKTLSEEFLINPVSLNN